MTVDVDALITLARETDRRDFAHKATGWYLLVLGIDAEPTRDFATAMLPREPPALMPPSPNLAAAPSHEAGRPQIHAIRKRPGNPWPDRISVGRAGNCDIVLRAVSVSKLHAHFRPQQPEAAAGEGGLALIDCHSQNGTTIDGMRLHPDRPAPVSPGQRLVFGRVAARLLDAGGLYDVLRSAARSRPG